MIVLIIHNVPSHSSNPKDTCSQTTDKNAADNGSTSTGARHRGKTKTLYLYASSGH